MPNGLFTLRQQLQGLVQKAWYTGNQPSAPPFSSYSGYFSGTSQYLSLADTTNLELGSGNFTIEAYINSSWTSSGATAGILTQYDNAGSTGTYIFGIRDSVIYCWDGGTNYIGLSKVSNVGWVHVAWVRNGSGTNNNSVYVNGTLDFQFTNTTNFTGASQPVQIGRWGTTINQYTGYISNLRLVKGTAVYTSNFIPTGPLTAISGTQLLTLQNATIIDNSANGYSITNNGSVTTTATTIAPILPLYVNGNSTPAIEYLVVAGGGGAGYGGGGGGAGGLISGLSPITQGTSYYVTIGSGGAGSSAVGTAGTNGTQSVLFATSSGASTGNFIALGGGGGGSWNGASTNAGTTPNSGGSGGGGSAGYNTTYTVTFGGAGTSGQGNAGAAGNSTNSQPYMGGGGGGAGTVGIRSTTDTSASSANGGAGISSSISGSVSTYAGGGAGGSAGGAYANNSVGGVGGGGNLNTSGASNTGGGGGGGNGAGTVTGSSGGSGIVIISYPDIYNAPTSVTGTVTSSTSGSGSLSFNGSTTYVTGPTTSSLNFSTGSFTVEFWAYATTIGTLTEFFTCTNAGQDFQIGLSTTNYLYWHNSGVQIANVGTPASCPLNQWNHIVFVRSGTNCALFCNGVRYGTTTNSASVNLTNYYIGAYWNAVNAYNLNGYMTNIRVSNTAIYSPTSSTLTVPTAPFNATSSTVLLMSTVSGSQFVDSSTSSLTNSVTGPPTWNQASPFATGLGYKNRVYTWTGNGTVTF